MSISDQLRDLAVSKGIMVPDWYLNLVNEFKDGREVEEVYLSPDMVKSANEEFVENNAWGFKWKPNYWAFGGDGAGGIYFFDASNPQSPVYYIDHEDPPIDIDDVDRLSVQSPEAFRDFLIESEIEFQRDCERMRMKVANRKWWQIWVPRKVPAWACHQSGERKVDPPRPLH